MVPPSSGCFKLNFGGSANGNIGNVGNGGIIRVCYALHILYYSGPIGFCSVSKAELLALKGGHVKLFILIFTEYWCKPLR